MDRPTLHRPKLSDRVALRLRRAAIEPRVVWILGSGRSGSTWLMNLIAAATDGIRMDEPLLGAHLGVPLSVGSSVDDPEERTVYDNSRQRGAYMFSDETRWAWEPPLRQLVLARFAAELQRAPAHTNRDTLLIVKEPKGSRAAPLLAGLMPKSRLLFLLRDGRDVVDSMVDAAGSDWVERATKVRLADSQRREYIERRAHTWVAATAATRAAYEAHDPQRRLMVKYEELRTGTEAELTRIVRWLGRDVAPEKIARLCAQLAFEALPDEAKGDGKFHRAATPGLWRERFTAEESDLLHSILGPTLTALGYET